MTGFSYARPQDLGAAVRTAADRTGTVFVAGGTNLVDLMKAGVATPAGLVDINALPLRDITELDDGGLRLGALATNAATAYNERVVSRYPLLASAILAGASAQLRNAATNGGNLNQPTRCYYFYDTGAACNKRAPGSGCDAIGGVNRIHAILGASPQCIATHPSDMCVALAALEATVRVTGPAGERAIAFDGYHRLPGDEPWRDNTLEPGEIVTAVDLSPEGFADHHTYLKLCDRQSYAFALVSVAVGFRIKDGRIAKARIALGGVAHKPWRVPDAEHRLVGQAPEKSSFAAAADAILAGATGQGENDFKPDLARRAVVRACEQAAVGTPQTVFDKRIA